MGSDLAHDPAEAPASARAPERHRRVPASSFALYAVAVVAAVAAVVIALLPFRVYVHVAASEGSVALDRYASCSNPLLQVVSPPVMGQNTQLLAPDGTLTGLDTADLQPICEEMGRWRVGMGLLLVVSAALAVGLAGALASLRRAPPPAEPPGGGPPPASGA